MKIKRLIREVHLNATVDQFAEVGPIFEVACAPVNLMDHDAARISLAQSLEHRAPDRPAFFSRRLLFLEPPDNGQVRASGTPLDGAPLFGKRDAAFALFCGRSEEHTSELQSRQY